MSLRRNWVLPHSLPRNRACLPPWTQGQGAEEQHSLAVHAIRGGGGPIRTTGKKAWHFVYSVVSVSPNKCLTQRKDMYNVHRTPGRQGSILASWRKMTQPASFVGDGSFRVFPMRAHPRNETLDGLSTLTSQVLHLLSQVKSRTAGRGQWGMVSPPIPLPIH